MIFQKSGLRSFFTCLLLLCSLLAAAQVTWKELNAQGIRYFKEGQYEKAAEVLGRALEAGGNEFGKNHLNYATALNNLAVVFDKTGDYGKSELLYREAMEIRGRLLGKEHKEYAASLNNLGTLYLNTGDYVRAESFYREAIQVQAKATGKENPTYFTYLKNLAVLYDRMGNYEKAKPLHLESLEYRAKVYGTEHPEYAEALVGAGLTYLHSGDYFMAESMFSAALQIREKTSGKQHPSYITALNNLATAYEGLRDYESAESMYLQALELHLSNGSGETVDFARMLSNLAAVYVSMKKYDQAIPLQRRALEVHDKMLGKDHPYYTGTLNNLAYTLYLFGDYSAAESFYLQVIDLKQRELAKVFPSLSEQEKQRFYQVNAPVFTGFCTFALARSKENPAILSSFLNLRLATKGLLFNSSGKIRDNILSANDPALIADFRLWKSRRDFLVKAYGITNEERTRKGIDIKTLEEEANGLEKTLSQRSALFSEGFGKKTDDWQQVRSVLKAGEAAVELMALLQRDNNGVVQPVYAALIVTPNTLKQPELVVLGKGHEMDGRFARYYRNAITKNLRDTVTYNPFWKPIAEKLTGVRKLYLSADGVYHQINVNTLLNPSTGKYVVDEMDVQSVTSLRDLLEKKVETNVVKNATLIGFPDYNTEMVSVGPSSGASPQMIDMGAVMRGDSTQRFFSGGNITELPGTRKEVEGIRSMLEKNRYAVRTFMAAEATEHQLKRLSSPSILHIATHGFFLADLPKGDDITTQNFAGVETARLKENPLLRSGLLFAGAKAAFSPQRSADGEDGILTAYEAMNLNLDKTSLVVMSACETGLGVMNQGEGVYGLQRAFQVAGARSVLMSLWKVNDEATQRLMILFYQYLLEGRRSYRDAFRMAQLKLRESYPDPYFWGAFVMVGD